jgi:hypothetical protein
MSSLSALFLLRLLAGDGVEAARDLCADLPPVEPDPYALAEPRVIEHKVTAGEHIADIAVRYGVDPSEVTDENEIDPWVRQVRVGKMLRIRARRMPPARERLVVRVEPGETWSSIAIEHRVPARMLRAYNWRRKKLRTGDEIAVWIDPGAPRTLAPASTSVREPSFEPMPGGLSRGRPQIGRIRQAVELPESSCYRRGKPEWMWGSSHTIVELQRALWRLRHIAGYRGEIEVGAISLKRGGRFPPHRSHQSGRDVDIRLPLLPGVARRRAPHPDEVDWSATWALVDALFAGEQVQVVFLETKLQKRLYEAARWQGVAHDRLGELLQALDPERRGTVIRDAEGHDGHLHVRFSCGPHEPDCKG